MTFEEALRGRRSVRAFLPDPVPPALIRELLELATLAPSGTNIQPWKAYVVSGAARDRLVQQLLAYRETDPPDLISEFPRSLHRHEPYVSRMRTLGKDMYRRLGIPKGDTAAQWRQWGRNYQFFDAPVGIILTMDRNLDAMSFLDIGIFVQSFMLAATDKGLATCAQGAWNCYWSATKRCLGISEDEFVVVGIALGYADPEAPVNALVAERETVDNFTIFFDDDLPMREEGVRSARPGAA